ncbi:MAG: DUF2330 domain-containing protein [Actinomycetota bacterium]
MRKRILLFTGTVALVVVLGAGPALACGGLVSTNGTIQLVRTTTLAAYHNGLEHYVTGFKFVGDGAEFGSIVPLPANPERIVRGGNWTLQRLEREVHPPVFAEFDSGAAAATAAPSPAVVVQEKDVDSLHLTVVKGGAFGVGKWATDHGFLLPPDAPTVLDFYAKRSPYFMAVQFDAKKAAARGERIGDAIPIHLVMRTKEPWVPLRILGLGASPKTVIQADVFLLTDRAPNMLPVPAGNTDIGPQANGLVQRRSEGASSLLLSDLGSDRGMKWLPRRGMWFTFLTLDAKAGDLTYDLALNVNGGSPSPVDAGFASAPAAAPSGPPAMLWAVVVGVGLLVVLLLVAGRERRGGARIAM